MNTRALTLAFRMGVRQAVGQPFAVAGQLLLMIVLIGSYGAILKAIPTDDLIRLHLTSVQLVWYVALTETVMMLGLWHCRHFQHDIANGLIDVWLMRPTSFWMLLLAEWAGEEVIRLLPTAAMAIILGRIISGGWPEISPIMALIVPAILCGMALMLCSSVLLGLASIWIGNTTAGLWIYYKCIFIFGALLWPMAFYPIWLSRLAWLTPFPAILAATGDLILPGNNVTALVHILQQAFWVIAFLGLCGAMASAARQRLAQ